MIVGTRSVCRAAGAIDARYKILDVLPCVLWSVAVFVFIKYACAKGGAKIKAVCMKLSGYTFGIYLVHWYILEVYNRIYGRFANISHAGFVYSLTTPFVVTGLSLAAVYLLKRIPLIRHMTPS